MQVEEYSGLHVQPHKAIVGANAFAHESGIHQVCVICSRLLLKETIPERGKSSYQFMDIFSFQRSTKLLMEWCSKFPDLLPQTS